MSEYTIQTEWDYNSTVDPGVTFRLQLLTPAQRAECTKVTVVDKKTIITPSMEALIRYGVLKIKDLIINKDDIDTAAKFNNTPLNAKLQDLYDDVAIEIMTRSREDDLKNS